MIPIRLLSNFIVTENNLLSANYWNRLQGVWKVLLFSNANPLIWNIQKTKQLLFSATLWSEQKMLWPYWKNIWYRIFITLLEIFEETKAKFVISFSFQSNPFQCYKALFVRKKKKIRKKFCTFLKFHSQFQAEIPEIGLSKTELNSSFIMKSDNCKCSLKT